MKKFSIYRLISILAFIALVFILVLPNFFDINKKQETDECIKNMKVVYGGAAGFLQTEMKDFSGTSSDLERMGYLSKSYECPSEAPGDKYHVKVDAETNTISVRCINEMSSSPDLTSSSFEDFVYFLNIIKFHQKPTSEYIYNILSDETHMVLDEHEAYSSSLFDTRTVLDWEKFIANLKIRGKDPMLKEIWELFSPEFKVIVQDWHRVNNPLSIEQKELVTAEINEQVLTGHNFSDKLVKSVSLVKEGRVLNKRGYSDLKQIEKQRLNRILMEAIFPYEFQVSSKYNFPNDDLQDALIDNINELLAANAFDTQEFINMIKLSGDTVSMMEEQPNSRVQISLKNRLLLQDAYPSLLVKYEDQYSDHRLPSVD
jgi:competence protein ComGC